MMFFLTNLELRRKPDFLTANHFKAYLSLETKKPPGKVVFRRFARVDALLNRGNWLGGAQSPNTVQSV